MSEIAAIRNARYLENGAVDCEVLFSDLPNFLPYTATSTDSAETGRRVWQELQSGKWGDIAPFNVTKEMLEEAKAVKRREIEAWRMEQEARSFTFEWKKRIWDAGPVSVDRLYPVVMLAKSDTVRNVMVWNDANNCQVTLSVLQLDELLTAMIQAQVNRNDEIYCRQREMKETLNNLEDLNSIREFIVE